MELTTDLLIIGAGPFGLAMAAYAKHLQIPHVVVGKPMEFWKHNMPAGMYLRSACDWHLDPIGEATLEHYLQTQGLTPAQVEPISRNFYLGYTEWFQQQKHIETIPHYVRQLDQIDGDTAGFEAHLTDGSIIRAKHVVVAVGFKYFANAPKAVTDLLPVERYAHTCDLVQFEHLRGKRCLIIGGRQSAFEWAALLNEAGASAVHISHRSASPAFAAADWSWVTALVDGMVDNPGWFRQLSQEEQRAVSYRLWAEGRLKVEPWLEKRVMTNTTKLWPNTQVVSCAVLPAGDLAITLDNAACLEVDQIILATGYKVDMQQVPFLASGNLLPRLHTLNGFPVLDEHFQTSVPNLFITSMPAGQDFGPFFGFTISVRTSAKLIGQAIASTGGNL